MPLQNRVTPTGEILAISARGTLTGNRGGKIHTPDRTLGVSRWKSKQWIHCLLEFKGRQREVMGKGYTELFFLDEVTALSAGHRPCGECQHAKFKDFKERWFAANREFVSGKPQTVGTMDQVLHSERVNPYSREKVTFTAKVADLPDGTFILVDEKAFLLWQSDFHQWSPDGYRKPGRSPGTRSDVTVCTPASIVKTLRAGYVPDVHHSVLAG